METIWSIIGIFFTFSYYFSIIAQENASDNEFCIVNTKSGPIRGKINYTLFEKLPFYSFRGIPYGKAPVGNLRFKAPQKIDPWNDIFDAFEFGNDCVQRDSSTNEIIGSEDCLNLNVFVPNKCSALNPQTKMPVVYFILGGQFQFGSASFYGPNFLMETNVIIVTVNFRVGPFGFITINDPEYSGNMQFKDQALGLRWVKENIEQFGGDANNITLFGHSSGASSINLHMLSPQSQNLFQKAILMSGSALNPFIPRRQDHYLLLSLYAEYVHYYPISSKNDLIEFLKQVDAYQLSKMSYQEDYVPGYGRKSLNRIWTACIEVANAINPFLIQAPFDILSNKSYQNNFDTLYSNSPREVALSTEGEDPELLKPFDEMFQIQLPLEFAHVDFNSECYEHISNEIREFYFNGGHVDAETLDNMNTLMTDSKFIYPSNLNARIQVAKSTGDTFYSIFSAPNNWSYSQRKARASNFSTKYPTHSDQLYYIFEYTQTPNVISPDDYQNLSIDSLQRQIIKTITNFYMNFAKYGNPMPGGEPFCFKASNSENFNFFNITNDGIVVEKDPYQDRMEFWDNIFYEIMCEFLFKFYYPDLRCDKPAPEKISLVLQWQDELNTWSYHNDETPP